MNCKVLLLTAILVIIIVTWTPILWGSQITIDKPKFATIYYTTLVNTIIDIAKILFGFWLANVYLHSFRFNRTRDLWRETLLSLRKTCNTFEKLDLKSGTYREQQDKLNTIYRELCRLRSRMDVITSLNTVGPFIDVLIKIQAIEYVEGLLGRINELCKCFELSEISIGKPLTVEQKKLIKDIRNQVERWIVEIDDEQQRQHKRHKTE